MDLQDSGAEGVVTVNHVPGRLQTIISNANCNRVQQRLSGYYSIDLHCSASLGRCGVLAVKANWSELHTGRGRADVGTGDDQRRVRRLGLSLDWSWHWQGCTEVLGMEYFVHCFGI